MFKPFFELFDTIQGTGITHWVDSWMGHRELCVTDDFGNAVDFNHGQALFSLV